MIGINIENLGKLIKVNNMNKISLETNINNLITIIDDLQSCYSGNELNYLFSSIDKEKDNLKGISNIVESYSEVLSNVKISYEQQDLNFHNLFKNSDN